MRCKGSLSVEAVISFTVFIGFSFLLLTLVKLVLMMIILNNASVEVTKTIATAAYPISIVNDAQEGLEGRIENTKPENLENSLKNAGVNSLVSSLIGADLGSAWSGNISSVLEGYLGELGANLLKDVFYSLKGQGVNWLCGQIVSDYMENCGLSIDPQKLMLRAAKIPETDAEFKYNHSANLTLSEQEGGLSASPSSTPSGTNGDFCADDVLLCLEYPYEIALPLLPPVTLTLRSVSVERAWINPSATGPKRTEGIDLNDLLFGSDSNIVYVATGGHGKCYHKKSDCNTLWTSNSAIAKTVAVSSGLRPCKKCYPEEKK